MQMVAHEIKTVILPPGPPSLRAILLDVCASHFVSVASMIGPCEHAKVVAARRAYFWRARQETTHSFPRIARLVNRDHTTAVYHYHRVARGEVGIEPFRKSRPRRPREQEAIALRESGLSWREVGVRMGVKTTTAQNYGAGAKRRRRLAAEAVT